GRIELAFFLAEDHRIDRREPASTLLLGPGDAGEARLGLGLLVGLRGLEIFLLREPALQAILVIGLRLAGLAQERAAFFAEFRFLGRVVEIHRDLPSRAAGT